MNQNGSFYDVFGLCGLCGARRGIGLWANNDFTANVVKTVCVFSTGQLPNLRAQGSNCKHLGNSAREMNTQCFEVLGLGYCRTPSLCGILKPSRSLCTQKPKPKGDWASQSINQIQSIAWEGLKQPMRPIITSVDGTTAEQLTHTKKRALSLSLARGSSKVWWKTNVWFHRWMRRRSWRQHGSFNSPATQRLEYFPHVRWLMQLCCDV